MKIGIMTWFYGDNYGAMAHSYALQQTIRSLKHECVMIALYPRNLNKMNIRMNLNYTDKKKHPILASRCLLRNYKFFKVRKELYNISKKVSTADEIDALNCDLIILGSDEVFKVKHPYFNKLFYGVGLKTPTISYAPSAGQTPDDYELSDEIKKAIKKIRFLSVRDRHTYELLKSNTQREAQIVLDPTFLYDFKDIAMELSDINYILVYSFDTLDEYKKRIVEYAKEYEMKIICIGRNCRWADKSYDSIDFKHWIGAFAGASMVVTDSFHGVVFAIKNKQKFVILGREDKINKINDLLQECGITLDFYTGKEEIKKYLNKSFSYNEIDFLIEKKKNKSISYLIEAIEGVKQ